MTEFRTRRWVAKGACAMLVAVALAGCAQKPTNTGAGAATPGSQQDFAINVGDRVFFTVDSSEINSTAASTLDRQAAWLQKYPRYQVTVEGHADERGTREYNIALSARRAEAARRYLAGRGVAPNRMRTQAFGKERPVAVCDNESCWNQNRRAVTVLGN
ncbi:peptidoglycan-associated lipoprotein Pal [Acuticoccus sediminis]|uniref:Peptidoglycan-associated lipoprotein n=1 Tax=Acuticoccus sediminis TaxID=2184697 RepID=A0A8B2NZG8_9HYPH|nr:peptidoglycan-associated lipoprotein Pal [Acuticoccus sediminis]RAI03575.1 peptidoglycan-associated lipoprotein Pal [Acuticoccus sediminis]